MARLFDLTISICHLSVAVSGSIALLPERVGSSARTHADLSGIV